MPNPNGVDRTREVEELKTTIEQMANRVSARFVLDEQKAQNFVAAAEQRQRQSSTESSE